MIAFIPTDSGSLEDPPPIDQVVENLAREMTSWKTMSMKVRYDWDTSKGGPAGKQLLELFETSSGKRAHHSVFTDANGMTSHDGAICDGEKCWNLKYDPSGELKSVVIAKAIVTEERFGTTIRPRPLQSLYVGLLPLHEAIRKATWEGGGSVIGRPCDVYRISGVKTGRIVADYVYYLDRETSIPLRLEGWHSSGSPPQPARLALWEANSLDTFSGYHLPKTSVFLAFDPPDAAGNQREKVRHVLTVEALEYDKPIAENTFVPVIGPGVSVLDTLAKRVAPTPSPVPEPNTSMTPSGGVEAVQPKHWTSFMPMVGLGFGMSVVVLGLLIWLRSKLPRS